MKSSKHIHPYSTFLSEQNNGETGNVGLEFISPTKQSEWTWPAILNFFLGGAGAGFYLLSFMTILVRRGTFALTHQALTGPLAFILVGLGFVFIAAEVGRPFRFPYLLCHLKRAWISRETLAFICFLTAVALDYFSPHLAFKTWAALSALVILTSHGFIVYSSRAIPAWNTTLIPFLFLSSGLTSGVGVALLLAASRLFPSGTDLVLPSLICIISNLIIWLFYLRRTSDVSLPSEIKALRSPVTIFFTILLSHLLPLLLLLVIKSQMYTDMGGDLPLILFAASGLATLTGAVAQKSAILLAAGYTREISLKP